MAKTQSAQSGAPNQQRALQVYDRALWSLFLPGLILSVGAQLVLFRHFDADGRFRAAWGELWPLLNGAATGVLFVWARRRGMAALRRNGLLHEEREVVARTETALSGETVEFRSGDSKVVKFALACVWLLLALACGWLSRLDSLLAEVVGLSATVLFGALALLGLFTIDHPGLRMDDRGVFGFQYSLWPRFVSWHAVASVEFTRVRGLPDKYFGGVENSVRLRFQNSSGHSLLTLHTRVNPPSQTHGKRVFSAELRRRLTGDDPTVNAEASDG